MKYFSCSGAGQEKNINIYLILLTNIALELFIKNFRWNYTDPSNPEAPYYNLYTGLTAKMTLMVFFILLSLHTLMVALVKLCTSEEFRSRDGSRFQKVIHVISNINIPTPFRDWDVGDFSVEEHKRRRLRTEM